MSDLNPPLDNCKPRRIHFEKNQITEWNSSLDEMLAPSHRHLKISYQQALDMIKRFSYIIKDCNFVIEPEN